MNQDPTPLSVDELKDAIEEICNDIINPTIEEDETEESTDAPIEIPVDLTDLVDLFHHPTMAQLLMDDTDQSRQIFCELLESAANTIEAKGLLYRIPEYDLHERDLLPWNTILEHLPEHNLHIIENIYDNCAELFLGVGPQLMLEKLVERPNEHALVLTYRLAIRGICELNEDPANPPSVAACEKITHFLVRHFAEILRLGCKGALAVLFYYLRLNPTIAPLVPGIYPLATGAQQNQHPMIQQAIQMLEYELRDFDASDHSSDEEDDEILGVEDARDGLHWFS